MRMKIQIISGILIFLLGIYFGSFNSRPWLDFDFIVAWFGLLLFLDGVSGGSLFKNIRVFLILAFTSAMFWWFYDWANFYLGNWNYIHIHKYSPMEAGVQASVAFTTVLPNLIVGTNIINTIFPKTKLNLWRSTKKVNKTLLISSITFGIACILLSITIPYYFFGLIWGAFFLIFDPINAYSGEPSLIKEALDKNFKPALVLALASIIAGLLWESINFLILKWTYPITPFFWQLPYPLTAKYIEMPIAGFIGYIPFMWGAFAFVKFLRIEIPWLGTGEKK